MEGILLVSILAIWLLVLCLGFLLLGTLRALGLVSWRLEQLEATTPSRIGRSGLNLGKKAPDFTLPSATGGELALHDFAGRNVLLVFTQTRCGPCHSIVPELKRIQARGEQQVLVVNNGDPKATRRWAEEVTARFPVLAQEEFSVSKRYQVFATPFAFLIDEKGIITSKGIVGSKQHLGYVLAGAGKRPKHDDTESEADAAEKGQSEESFFSEDVTHV